MHPDNKYIQALIDNDQRLINEIYTQNADRIAAFIMRNNGNRSDAEDVLQESLVYIYHKAKSDGLEIRVPFKAFLHMVCRGKWLNELKKRKRNMVTPLADFGHKDASVSENEFGEIGLDAERDRLLWNKFKDLSDRCREILSLSWSGTGMQEVAEKLDISYAYARKRKTECISSLMKKIKSSAEYKLLKD